MTATYAVSGVASGIGAELAKLLIQDGHRVIGFDLRAPTYALDKFIAIDLNDPEAIDDATAKAPCGLDGLCNIAGLPPRPGLETNILQVNFLGQRRFTNSILDRLKPGASVVNMASRAGAAWRDNLDQVMRLAAIIDRSDLGRFVTSEDIDATRCYNLSKEAMIVWTMAMTEELIGREMRMNALSPGAVATGILDDFAKAFGDKMGSNVARAGRPAHPEEVAKIARFLLSPDSAWLKGIDIPIDGGMGAFNQSDMLGLERVKTTISAG
ncbi:MAG: coniferyl-alcohol dehydrogenase [Pseudomonadota bacterium]